jgi:hypothetical protein
MPNRLTTTDAIAVPAPASASRKVMLFFGSSNALSNAGRLMLTSLSRRTHCCYGG